MVAIASNNLAAYARKVPAAACGVKKAWRHALGSIYLGVNIAGPAAIWLVMAAKGNKNRHQTVYNKREISIIALLSYNHK